MSFMPPPGPPPGPSHGQQHGPPHGPPHGHGPQHGPHHGPPPGHGPAFPPPSFEPTISAFAVDPRSISRCLFRNTFVWLTNGNRFWFFPTFVGNFSVSGFRWTGRFWVIFGISLREISSFTCF
ncbi:hypothetical protein NV381_10170 [Paenibacillus sp. N5-1-1-5]|uniref:Transporter n=1 Tax=Paenibacillus radicis (ex Xue et al. 2023) TaxID=2972489 RepID=A0ABT1YEE7_9BACL|nr:hypothetical protein [Paenibacillus radicis (ex Xue et al. 2023)]MCR8631567.1 hypothetical protein [Paenibacillus radicis (ex Xue et al. 2023)]